MNTKWTHTLSQMTEGPVPGSSKWIAKVLQTDNYMALTSVSNVFDQFTSGVHDISAFVDRAQGDVDGLLGEEDGVHLKELGKERDTGDEGDLEKEKLEQVRNVNQASGKHKVSNMYQGLRSSEPDTTSPRRKSNRFTVNSSPVITIPYNGSRPSWTPHKKVDQIIIPTPTATMFTKSEKTYTPIASATSSRNPIGTLPGQILIEDTPSKKAHISNTTPKDSPKVQNGVKVDVNLHPDSLKDGITKNRVMSQTTINQTTAGTSEASNTLTSDGNRHGFVSLPRRRSFGLESSHSKKRENKDQSTGQPTGQPGRGTMFGRDFSKVAATANEVHVSPKKGVYVPQKGAYTSSPTKEVYTSPKKEVYTSPTKREKFPLTIENDTSRPPPLLFSSPRIGKVERISHGRLTKDKGFLSENDTLGAISSKTMEESINTPSIKKNSLSNISSSKPSPQLGRVSTPSDRVEATEPIPFPKRQSQILETAGEAKRQRVNRMINTPLDPNRPISKMHLKDTKGTSPVKNDQSRGKSLNGDAKLELKRIPSLAQRKQDPSLTKKQESSIPRKQEPSLTRKEKSTPKSKEAFGIPKSLILPKRSDNPTILKAPGSLNKLRAVVGSNGVSRTSSNPKGALNGVSRVSASIGKPRIDKIPPNLGHISKDRFVSKIREGSRVNIQKPQTGEITRPEERGRQTEERTKKIEGTKQIEEKTTDPENYKHDIHAKGSNTPAWDGTVWSNLDILKHHTEERKLFTSWATDEKLRRLEKGNRDLDPKQVFGSPSLDGIDRLLIRKRERDIEAKRRREAEKR